MASESRALDFDKIKEFVEHVFGFLEGAVISGMIYLGDRLGLYRALQGAEPMTSEELARKTGLNERWVREWLRSQAGAKLLDYKGDGRFELSLEATFVLAEENSPAFAAGGFHSLPQQFAVLEKLPQSFQTGVGLPYDAFGPEGAVGIERFLAPWFRAFLVPVALPRLDGVVARLERGAKVADVGCGAGIALLEMAKAYPRSTFHGYDISKHALARADENKRAAAVTNVTFHDASVAALPADASFDFITTFDCLHDMAHPEAAIRAIRQAIKPDGTWLIADINAKPTFEQNLDRNPMVAMMYGMSVMSCMSSALSEPGGAGLGTLGFTESLAREMTAAVGFTRFTRHDFDNPVNAYYEVRP
ncbi:MAG TPA: methyltransferase domain-containing protein [Candidatus Binatia bacterium]|nr:methyltransferase domain-containing protein [Candidatus Binatia bacterium]